MSIGIKVKVWGDYALFCRPEMKTERCSYDVMTPSAARGILDAIDPSSAYGSCRIIKLSLMLPGKTHKRDHMQLL